MAKLNLTDIAIAYGACTVASVTTGLVGGYVLTKFGYDVDFPLVVSTTWLATVGIPSLAVSAETLRRTLGRKEPTTIRAGSGLGRKIPVTANGKAGFIFASIMPGWPGQTEPQTESGMLQTFSVTRDSVEYSLTETELLDFLSVCWRRQLGGKNGLSRAYWMRRKKAIDCTSTQLGRLQYDAAMACLLACPGLVLDRSAKRSGRLALPPRAAIKEISRILQ